MAQKIYIVTLFNKYVETVRAESANNAILLVKIPRYRDIPYKHFQALEQETILPERSK